jgi:hypothetical protein
MRYAIGEIVLVVIGILIALQINTWNEDRVKKIALKEHLKNMIENLNQDIENNQTIVKNIEEFRLYSMLYLLDISGHEPNYLTDFEPDKDFVPVEWLWKGEIPKEFDEQFVKVTIRWMDITTEGSGNYESPLEKIKDDRLFSYIEEPDLKSAIENHYGEENFRFGEGQIKRITKYRNDWQDILNSAGFNAEYIKDPKDVIVWLENSPEAIAKLRNLASNAKWQCESFDIINENAKKLIEDINTYLLENN